MKRPALLLAACLLLSAPAAAQEGATLSFGGDIFAAGQSVAVRAPAGRDVFMAGSDVDLAAATGGSAHLAGFDVDAAAPVGGDIHALGFSVDITGGAGRDVTAAGNTVTLRSEEAVGGNVRLAGQSVTIASPVGGAALVSAQTLTLDAPISGDLSFFGQSLVFGPAARVEGTLSIQAPQQIAVPPGVASAERVRFTAFTPPDYMTEAGRTAADSVAQGLWSAAWLAVGLWLLLLVTGAAIIALAPRKVERLRLLASTRPLHRLGLGVLALAALLGLVPVFALTLIGLAALPVVLAFVALGCALGYLAGVFFVGIAIARGLVAIDSNLKRVSVLAIALLVAGMLGMIPLLGWLITLLLTIFGLGVVAAMAMVRWSRGDAARLQPGAPGAVA